MSSLEALLLRSMAQSSLNLSGVTIRSVIRRLQTLSKILEQQQNPTSTQTPRLKTQNTWRVSSDSFQPSLNELSMRTAEVQTMSPGS